MLVKIDNLNKAEAHIWELIGHYLHKHNELCIAGFGRFAKQTQGYIVDPVAKKIIPSAHKVYFQVGEFETSPEFIQFLNQCIGSDAQSHVDKLASFVNAVKTDLQANFKLIIPHFGSFSLQVTGELSFECATGISFNENTFGLIPVHFAANLLKTKRIVVEKPEEEGEEKELTQMRESALKELKVLLDNARIAESQKPKKTSKVFPIIASALTLILLVNLGIFLFNGPVDQLKQQVSQMNILGKTGEMLDTQMAQVKPAIAPVKVEPNIVVAEIPSADSILQHVSMAYTKGVFDFDSTQYTYQIVLPTADTTIFVSPVMPIANAYKTPDIEIPGLDEEIAVAKPIKKIEKPKALNSGAPNMVNVDALKNGIEKGFYVIAGAFKIEANAQKLKNSLNKKGEIGVVVFKPSAHPYYLVAFQKSANLNQALNILEKNQAIDPTIWVYCAY